jgi:hypothetical protein
LKYYRARQKKATAATEWELGNHLNR